MQSRRKVEQAKAPATVADLKRLVPNDVTRAYVTSILLARASTPTPMLCGTLGNLLKTMAKAARKAAGAIHQALAATKAEKVTATQDRNHRNVQSKQIGANFARSISRASAKRATNVHNTTMDLASSILQAPALRATNAYLRTGIHLVPQCRPWTQSQATESP